MIRLLLEHRARQHCTDNTLPTFDVGCPTIKNDTHSHIHKYTALKPLTLFIFSTKTEIALLKPYFYSTNVYQCLQIKLQHYSIKYQAISSHPGRSSMRWTWAAWIKCKHQFCIFANDCPRESIISLQQVCCVICRVVLLWKHYIRVW